LGGNQVVFVIRHLRVAQLAQINHPRLVRVQPQLGEVVVYVIGRHAKADAGGFIALVGEE
jgi:hypothetical protein